MPHANTGVFLGLDSVFKPFCSDKPRERQPAQEQPIGTPKTTLVTLDSVDEEMSVNESDTDSVMSVT